MAVLPQPLSCEIQVGTITQSRPMNFNIFLCFFITFTEIFDGEYIESADFSGSRSISASCLDMAMGCISVSLLSLISAFCFLLYNSFLVNPYVLHSFDVIANGFFCDFLFRNDNFCVFILHSVSCYFAKTIYAYSFF